MSTLYPRVSRWSCSSPSCHAIVLKATCWISHKSLVPHLCCGSNARNLRHWRRPWRTSLASILAWPVLCQSWALISCGEWRCSTTCPGCVQPLFYTPPHCLTRASSLVVHHLQPFLIRIKDDTSLLIRNVSIMSIACATTKVTLDRWRVKWPRAWTTSVGLYSWGFLRVLVFWKCLEILFDDSLVSWEHNAINGSGFGLQMAKLCMNEWRVVHGL